MARQVVDIGVEGNDGTGDSIRESFRKVNTNFQEIYAVVGKGGQITWTTLSDTPDSLDPYQGNGEQAYIPIVAQDASGIEIRRLASNSEETGGVVADTVTYSVTQDGVLILKTANAQIEQDSSPSLGGPLDVSGGAIANISITQDAINEWNSVHAGQLTVDDLVIDKGFADANYYGRQVPGEEVNIRVEPSNTSSYFKDFVVSNTYAEITSHGLTQGSTGAGWFYSTTGDAIEYTYTERLQSGAAQTISGTLSEGQPVYIRRRSDDLIELYLTESDALLDNNVTREEKRLKLDSTNSTGTHTIENPYYDSTLPGNWLSNEAIPRDSVVRRQGDNMTGELFLSDHPGSLAGAGTPNGPEDLQAVTKLYVDSQSTESSTNLFVSTQGSDDQRLVPPGIQGRSLFYAFKSVAAAARQAEAIQLASKYEPGPFMQDITYTETSGSNVTSTRSVVTAAEVNNAATGDVAVKRLVDANVDFIVAEVFAWIDGNISTETTTTIDNDVTVDWAGVAYNKDVLEEELTRSINAAVLDHLSGTTANLVSKRVGQEYFAQLDQKARAGLTEEVYESAIARTREVISTVLDNNDSAPWGALQSDFDQVFLNDMPTGVPESNDKSSIDLKLELIQNIVDQGVFSAPLDITGNRYRVTMSNGGNDFVDQGDPQNRDLRVGKVVRGKTSGAIGRIVDYTVGNSSDDVLLLDLLAPVEFVRGEQLEFGNASKERNISIRVETGIYYEDFPIRLPANTSIVGDESRRCIVRPKRSVSQSPWANVYFYRDSEFDTLRGDTESVTGIPDPNLPVDGTVYVNPISGEADGYFGRHYLNDPTEDKNVDNNGQLTVDFTDNPGGFENSVTLIERNRAFVVAETIAWIEEQTSRTAPPTGFDFALDAETLDILNRVLRNIVNAVAQDLSDGGSINTLTEQGELFYDVPQTLKDAVDDSIAYVTSIWRDVLENTEFVRASAIDTFVGADSPVQVINENLTVDEAVYDSAANDGIMLDLTALMRFAFNASFNPAKPADQVDCFMLNDASMIRGVTVQGHGAFTAVLDPSGQILTKSPFVHNALTFSQSINRQAFRGGIFVDGFCANTPLTVTDVQDNGFRLVVTGEVGSALGLRKPLTPAPFYVNGIRYQVNDIPVYDPDAATPTATLVLDPFSGSRDANGNYQGFQLPVPTGGFDITLQTPGSRTVATNDLTLVNDMGYGVAAANGANVETASTFTFYCYSGYQAVTGAQIRSVSGTNSYGVYGVVAEGSDPNEVPDNVVLVNDIDQAAKTFSAEVVLFLDGNVSVAAGDTITQALTDGTGTVVYATNARQLYLESTSGLFNTNGEIEVNGIGQGVTPTRVDTDDYSNPASRLAIHFYETESVPNSRGDISYLHDGPGTISRYQVTTVDELPGVVLDGHIINDSRYTYTATTRDVGEVSGTDAVLLVEKTQKNGGEYTASVYAGSVGQDYKVGDTFTVSGADLNGTTPTHDAIVTVEEVTISEGDQNQGLETGAIARLSVTGNINIVAGLTPQRNGQVYRANFSTSNDEFNPDGLLDTVTTDQPLMLRSNRNFVFDRIRDTERLTIRPSTAINFQEQPEFTYRAISFARENSIGEQLDTAETYSGTDISYNFVQLVVDNTNKTLDGSQVFETDSSPVGSTTLGNSTGDTSVAIGVLSNRTNIYRLNNNQLTNQEFRPPFANNAGVTLEFTNELPMIVTWQGKKHYAYNYREVFDDGIAYQVQSSFDPDANTFALVDLLEVDGAELDLSGPTTFERLGPTLDVAIVRQLTSGATGKVKVAAEESTVMKLYDLTGTFNTSDALEISYDNGATYSALLDNASTAVTIEAVDIRDTNLSGQATGIAEPLSTPLNDVVTLRAAIQDGSPAVITIQISTVRATGHDFNDVGTGSFNDTNFPNIVLGDPINDPNQAGQVQERDKGRVFYTSTDQDGLFKVGRFLTVDQGTGIVTFAANIALSDVDGIGFRRGVVVTEFSTDTAMSDNATDAVPTESAVRGYISRRLGFDQSGNPVSNPLGPSVITANGAVAMDANLSLAGFTITNLAPVDLDTTSLSSAVPRAYVDSRAEAYNKFAELRDVEIELADSNQLIGLSGVKTLYILTNTINGTAFDVGQVLTNSTATSNYGNIVGRRATYDENLGNVLIISFQPGPDTFNEVDPNASSPTTIYHKASAGAGTTDGNGGVKSGPFFEVINLAEASGQSDVQLTIDRPNNSDQSGSLSDEPEAFYNLTIKPNVITNSNIAADAVIAQSKLDMQEATATASGPAVGDDSATAQAQLGLASFDSTNFDVTRGWVQLKNNGISASDLQQIPTDTVLGRNSAGTGNVSPIAFSTVVNEGNGLQLTDFPYTDPSNNESADFSSGGVLTRKGADDFTVIPITSTGGNNSFVKTTGTGRIVANDVAIGKDNTFVVLSVVGTNGLKVTTPSGGTVLTSQGSIDPKVEIPGNLDVGSTGVSQTNIQANSGSAGDSWVASRWARHSFIESITEGGAASTGISIGSGSGRTINGQVGIITANTGNNTSPIPFLFTSDGVRPDIDEEYDIGVSSERYNNLWIRNVNASGTLAVAGSSTFDSNVTVDGTLQANSNLSVQGLLTVAGLNNTGNTTLGDALTDSVTVNGQVNSNIVPVENVGGDSGLNIGSNTRRWNTMYATVFDGTATNALYADLAENYLADSEYEVGTVLVFGGEEEVTVTSTKGDHRSAGVVSTNPAHLMNSGLTGNYVTALALQGRVPCKVIGKVKKGDIIVTAGIEGYGCVNNTPAPGTMIGKAVGVKDTDGKGTVEVVVGR